MISLELREGKCLSMIMMGTVSKYLELWKKWFRVTKQKSSDYSLECHYLH